MIKNIVFDMGNVLLKYAPTEFIQRITSDSEEQRLLLKEIFHSVEWLQRDRGTISEEGILKRVCQRLPEPLHPVAAKALTHWYEGMTPIEGMAELITVIKQKGYRIFLLSNTSTDYYEFKKMVPALELFDGEFISCEWRLVKPDKEIYRAFYSHFRLVPAECFFIDDSAANIEGALDTGMRGFLFQENVDELKLALQDVGVTF